MTRAPVPSYRGIFRIISLLATASVISVLFGLLRMKVAAVLLGPVGVGVIGLLQNASGIATTLGDMGMRQSGAREISKHRASDDSEAVGRIRQTLAWMAVVLSLVVSLPFFVFREEIASRLLTQPHLSNDVGWLTVVIVATILAAALTAVLNGYQRVREIGRITVFSAVASCAISIGALWLWKEAAIPIVVAAAPVTLFGYSLLYVAKIGALPRWSWPRAAHLHAAIGMMRLGVFVMLSAIALTSAEFLVRISIQHGLGSIEVGLFTAAWTIGVYYLNFLMVATSTEFFPRICTQMDDLDGRNHSINLQLQSMAVASFPVVVALTAFCPLVLSLLYSHEFTGADSILRLLVIGDVFRLAVYPLGFVLLAAGLGRSFFILKLCEAVGFAGLTAVLLPYFGLDGVGAAHIVTFAFLFLSYQVLLNRRLGFRLTARSMGVVAALVAAAIALSALAVVNEVLAGVVGGVLGIGWILLVLYLYRASVPQKVG